MDNECPLVYGKTGMYPKAINEMGRVIAIGDI